MGKHRKFIKYYTIKYFDITIDVIESEYIGGKRIALQSIEHNSGAPYAVLTKDIPSYNKDYPNKRHIFLDCATCPNIDKALKEAGLIGECLGRIQAGSFTYPIHEYLG